jgi:hypothetical protein
MHVTKKKAGEIKRCLKSNLEMKNYKFCNVDNEFVGYSQS